MTTPAEKLNSTTPALSTCRPGRSRRWVAGCLLGLLTLGAFQSVARADSSTETVLHIDSVSSTQGTLKYAVTGPRGRKVTLSLRKNDGKPHRPLQWPVIRQKVVTIKGAPAYVNGTLHPNAQIIAWKNLAKGTYAVTGPAGVQLWTGGEVDNRMHELE